MYELIKLNERNFYIDCPAKIGVIKISDDTAVLIDSGNDKDAAKKVKRVLEAEGLRLSAIFNTHSHADHIGGNKYLQSNTGCHIYASGIEAAFTAHPILEPALLFGGDPPKRLRHKFLMAEPSQVQPITDAALPNGITAIPLPGHSFDMVGYKTDDGVFYIGDALASKETLEKYKISVLSDVAKYLDTLRMLSSFDADVFVPSHAAPCESIAALADYNIKATVSIAETVKALLRAPKAFDELLAELFTHYELKMSFEQHALVGSTLKAYLVYLEELGETVAEIAEGKIVWRSL